MKLLPCPYCGSDNVKITLYNHPTVVCQNCWAMGPKGTRLAEVWPTLEAIQAATKKAHKLWNKRVGPTSEQWLPSGSDQAMDHDLPPDTD